MNTKNICSCCSKTMLRHISKDRIYWFCRSCWQEMPINTNDQHYHKTSTDTSRLLIEKNAPVRISLP